MSNSFERSPHSEGGQDSNGIESQEQPGDYLYHMVPKQLQGESLVPLSDLQSEHPQTYAEAAAKYEGREHLMEQKIPTLGVKWNEVLHLTAVSPHEIKQALIEAGGQTSEMEWYKIPKSAISAEQTVVYSGESPGGHITDEEVKAYDENDLPGYAKLFESTRQYYKREIAAGRRPFLFHGVPHILYKGKINVGGLEKIKA